MQATTNSRPRESLLPRRSPPSMQRRGAVAPKEWDASFSLDALPILMFWAGPDPVATIRGVKALGVRCGQMGIPGDLKLEGAAPVWKAALEAEQFALVTVFAAFTGENYAGAPTVQRTVGFIPPATRREREKRTYEISDFAAELGVPSIALHVGFVPEDTGHPDYAAVRDMVRRVADHAAKRGQTFALETGQRSEEHTSELQSPTNLVCRLL